MEQLFGTIPSVLMTIGSNPEVGESLVFAAWKNVAGELLRKRTEPIEYRGECLIVAVQDETWRRHLEDLAPQFLARINLLTGDVNVNLIQFQIAPRNVKKAEKKTEGEFELNAAEIDVSLRRAAEKIDNPKLRKTFLAAATVYLARQKQD